MEAFLISLSICTSIFFLVSIIVLIRRQQKARQDVGYVISEGPVTHGQPTGAVVQHYPPPRYEANVYPATYVYPAQTISHVQVQLPLPVPMNGMQPSSLPTQPAVVNNGSATKAELSILPPSYMASETRTHEGAVETVSSI